MTLELDGETRRALWERLGELVEQYARDVGDLPLAPVSTTAEPWDFSRPRDPSVVLEAMTRGLREGIVHVGHPGYFGLFNPAPATLGVVSAALAAAFNPQLATHSHAPWPVEIERQVLAAFGTRFGYSEVEGTFTSGGAEANATALSTALFQAFPDLSERGLRALSGNPTLYVSAEGHATVTRAARLAGLGRESVRVIPADRHSRMKTVALREAIARDRAAGASPFFIVATAGTTSAGAIDPLDEIATIAERAGAWLHVDAAWGGLAALVPELRGALEGIARADSITFDAHKALSSPMGAGMYLSRRIGALARAFDDRGGYMPRDASLDPYAHSAQWSRRFIGLPVFAALAAEGFDGYATSLRKQIALAQRLREGLVARGLTVVNDTPLPLVCFVDPTRRDLDSVARAVIAKGAGWISVTRLASGARVLRACVNNHRTDEAHVDRLLSALER